jgi:hypothetical protein
MEGVRVTLLKKNSVDIFYRNDDGIAYSGIIAKSKLAEILSIPQNDITAMTYVQCTPKSLKKMYPEGAKAIIDGFKAWSHTSGEDFKPDSIYEFYSGASANNAYVSKLFEYARENAKIVEAEQDN